MNEIKSSKLKVVVNPVGAELWSIQDENGNEYLWQGDESIWKSKAPNLFPYIARLTDGCYTLNGEKYEMERHGFVRGSVLVAEQMGEDCVVFTLEENEVTKKQYPYDFKYKVIYKVVDNKLDITYMVENHSDKEMYFGVGAHPGFNVPFVENTQFEDYYIEFEEVCSPKKIEFTDSCYVSGEKTEYKFVDGKRFDLQHNMFDRDVVLLENVSKKLSIKSDKTNKRIVIDYPNFDFVGFWHMPKKEAPYLCIEPWTSLPSRDGIIEDLAKQDNLVKLEPNGIYENTWSVIIK